VAKDRAAPFSRKHRRYWIPVTGGMLLIGAINVALGFCSYEDAPKNPQRIELTLPARDAAPDAAGTLGRSDIPAPVMRAFAVKYPKTIPAGALVEGDNTIVLFPTGAAHTRATFRADGTFVSEQ
jgi:hypothetical protein